MSLAGLSLDNWLARLETLSSEEIVLGLERVQLVLERLALPLPGQIFHIAGTNGKGSTVAMLRSLLQQSGQRIGSYTSPHILEYNERISVDGKPVTDAEIVAAFERIESVRGDTPLTYFEFGTLAALLVFAGADVDVAILEVGLGGRLDAVNAVEPDGGIITNISLDHCDWLGDDIEKIGREKAGIMRADKPFVFASAELPASVSGHADSLGADLVLCGRDYSYTITERGWDWCGRSTRLEALELPSLRGEFQLANAAGVLALVEASGRHDLLQESIVDRAFGSIQVAGRMQSIQANENWLLDVAHNPASALALAQTLSANPPRGKTIAITGMLNDKDLDGVIGPLADVVDHWIAVTAGNARAVEAAELARRIANLSDRACLIATSVDEAVSFARELSSPNDQILVTGSFYVVGPVLNFLEL
jgi:dihydrofolate synthase/folylpolyglutamate synthase